MKPDTSPPQTLTTLVRDLRDESTHLIRQEIALAKAEVKEHVAQIADHSVQLAIGGFVGYAGVIVLLIGLGWLISPLLIRAGMDPDLARSLAPMVLGAVVASIGWVMVARARRAITENDAAFRQTVETARETKGWAQNKLQQSP